MKKLIVIFLAWHNIFMAQDTLRFRNGETMAVKVNEIGITEIKYNRFDNVNGPQYVVEKNDIRYIKYSNGQKDSFPAIKTAKAIEQPANFKVIDSSNDKIEIAGTKLFYKGNSVGEHRLMIMMKNLPQGDKRNKMLRAYDQMRQHKKNQYLFGFVGLGVGVAAPYIGLLTSIGADDFTPFGVGVLIGTSVGITGAALSADQKRKRNAKKLEMARIYNE